MVERPKVEGGREEWWDRLKVGLKAVEAEKRLPKARAVNFITLGEIGRAHV